MKPDSNLEAFYTKELLRFYDSQARHGKKYLSDTLSIWRLNAEGKGPYFKSYQAAVRQIGGRK
jgi:hypothetical protein